MYFKKEGIKVKRLSRAKVIFLIVPCFLFHTSLPTSLEFRQAAFSDHLTPYPVIMSSLVYQITQLMTNMDQYLSGFQKNAFLETNQELQDIKSAAQQIETNTTEILNINAYESNYTGALPVFNLGGTTHNDTTINYWDQPLIINDTDTQFTGVSVIRLQENIVYTPLATDVDGAGPYAAIVIEKDNVTIDFFGFSLSLNDINIGDFDEDSCPVCTDDIDGVSTVHGIYIKPGVKNTRIISSMGEYSKGSIRDFTGFGILAEGESGAANKIEQLTVDNMLIADNFGGISVEEASEISITNTNAVSNCCLNVVYGFYFANVTDALISKCKSNTNCSCDDVYGMYIKDCIGITVQHCETSFNQSTLTGSSFGVAITASSSTTTHSNTVSSCVANENLCSYVDGQQSVGFYLTGSSYNNLVENCTALSNGHGAIPAGEDVPSPFPQGYGVKVESSNFNEIHGNKAGTNLSYGIFDSLAASTSIFTKNIAFYNTTENYSVNFKDSSGTTEALEVTTLFPGDLSAINTATSELVNIEIKKVEAS